MGYKERMDEAKAKNQSRFEYITEYEPEVPQPYLVTMILGASPEQLMTSAMPLIAQGWEVASTIANGIATLTVKNYAMVLRMPNPEYNPPAT